MKITTMSRASIFVFLFFLTLMLLSCATWMPDNKTGLKVQILDQRGFPVSDASIGRHKLIEPYPGISATEYSLTTVGYITNEEGRHFLPMPPGEWQFSISHKNFGLIYMIVNIKPDAITERTIVLIAPVENKPD